MIMRDSPKERGNGVLPVTVYLPKEIHREVRKAARQNRRSMSAQIVILVENIVRGQA